MINKLQGILTLILFLFYSSDPASASKPAPAPKLACEAIMTPVPTAIKVNVINRGSSNETVEVTDVATGQVRVLEIKSDKRLSVVKAHPGGKTFIAISNEDKTLRVYNAKDGEELSRLNLNLLIESYLNFDFDIAPDGHSVLIWGTAEDLWRTDKRVLVKFDLQTEKKLFHVGYNYEPGSNIRSTGNHNGEHHIVDAKISSDGKYALVQLFGGLWGVINYKTGYLLFERQLDTTVLVSRGQPKEVGASSRFQYLESLGRFFIHSSGAIEILNANGKLLKNIPSVNQFVLIDHKSVLVSHSTGTVVLYDLESLEAVFSVNTGNLGPISRMQVTSDHRLILQMAVENELYTTHVFDMMTNKKIITAVAPLGNSGRTIEGLTPTESNAIKYISGVSPFKTVDYVDIHGLYLYQRFVITTTIIERIYDLGKGELVGSLDSSRHFVPNLNVSETEFYTLAQRLFEEFKSN